MLLTLLFACGTDTLDQGTNPTTTPAKQANTEEVPDFSRAAVAPSSAEELSSVLLTRKLTLEQALSRSEVVLAATIGPCRTVSVRDMMTECELQGVETFKGEVQEPPLLWYVGAQTVGGSWSYVPGYQTAGPGEHVVVLGVHEDAHTRLAEPYSSLVFRVDGGAWMRPRSPVTTSATVEDPLPWETFERLLGGCCRGSSPGAVP